ncbi:hypothetical protein MRB53_040568 [Persea americana]|nr:hypothetical protein MRB53_040568 [Persea americana]
MGNIAGCGGGDQRLSKAIRLQRDCDERCDWGASPRYDYTMVSACYLARIHCYPVRAWQCVRRRINVTYMSLASRLVTSRKKSSATSVISLNSKRIAETNMSSVTITNSTSTSSASSAATSALSGCSPNLPSVQGQDSVDYCLIPGNDQYDPRMTRCCETQAVNISLGCYEWC